VAPGDHDPEADVKPAEARDQQRIRPRRGRERCRGAERDEHRPHDRDDAYREDASRDHRGAVEREPERWQRGAGAGSDEDDRQ
jgi:hypothetical protein